MNFLVLYRSIFELVGDVPAAGAILDRFLHWAHVVTISGRSYRLKDQAVASPEKMQEKEKVATNSPAGGTS